MTAPAAAAGGAASHNDRAPAPPVGIPSASLSIRTTCSYPDAGGARLLIAPRAGGWALPSVSTRGPAGDSWWRETERLNAAVARAFGLRVTTLDCWAAQDAGAGGRAGVFVLEPAAPGVVLPVGLRWADAATLAATPRR